VLQSYLRISSVLWLAGLLASLPACSENSKPGANKGPMPAKAEDAEQFSDDKFSRTEQDGEDENGGDEDAFSGSKSDAAEEDDDEGEDDKNKDMDDAKIEDEGEVTANPSPQPSVCPNPVDAYAPIPFSVFAAVVTWEKKLAGVTPGIYPNLVLSGGFQLPAGGRLVASEFTGKNIYAIANNAIVSQNDCPTGMKLHFVGDKQQILGGGSLADFAAGVEIPAGTVFAYVGFEEPAGGSYGDNEPLSWAPGSTGGCKFKLKALKPCGS
jgi:hypothetical protein